MDKTHCLRAKGISGVQQLSNLYVWVLYSQQGSTSLLDSCGQFHLRENLKSAIGWNNEGVHRYGGGRCLLTHIWTAEIGQKLTEMRLSPNRTSYPQVGGCLSTVGGRGLSALKRLQKDGFVGAEPTVDEKLMAVTGEAFPDS